MTVKMS